MAKFTITANLNLQTPNLNQVIRNLQTQFANANVNVKINGIANANGQLGALSKNAQQASKNMGLLGGSIGVALSRFTTITTVTGAIVGFTRSLKSAISEAIQFEREVVKISQATGKTLPQLRGLVNEINSVSVAFGVSSEELILAARNLTQAGFAANKVAGALKILAQTELAATFDSIGDTTEGAIALLNQFGKEAQRTGTEVDFLEKSFSAINEVSKQFAVESADLVTTIRTTGSAFESAGGNLNELLALFTSVRSTTRESAESIATGFRTIFTRVQRVDTINALRNLGVELQDSEGKFIGPIEAVKRLSTALNTIDPRDFRFNLVVEELGGFRQVSKVIPLIQQFAVAQKALNVAQNSGGSLTRDSITAQQALSVQIAQTREEFLKFARTIVADDEFQSSIKNLLRLANAFLQVADTIKPLIPMLAVLGAVKGSLSLVGAVKSFGNQRRFSTGGPVPGSGSGDTVPALLTPGEFVINKKSAQAIGHAALRRANKYADGGIIRQSGGSGGAIGVRRSLAWYNNYRQPTVTQRPQGQLGGPPGGGGVGGGNNWGNNASKQIVQVVDAIYKSRVAWLAVASVVASVTTEYRDLTKEQKAYESALTGSFAAFLALGLTLKNFASQIGEALNEKSIARNANKAAANALGAPKTVSGGLTTFSKVSVGFDVVLVGLSAVLAQASADIALLTEKTRAYSEELGRTQDLLAKDPSKIGVGRITTDINKTLGTADLGKELSNKVFSVKGISKIAAATIAGAGISAKGAALATAPAVAATAGLPLAGEVVATGAGIATAGAGIAGGYGGGYAEYSSLKKQAEEEVKAREAKRDSIGADLGSSQKVGRDFVSKSLKFLSEADKKSNDDVSSMVNEASKDYVKSVNSSVAAERKIIELFGSVEKAPKEWADQLYKSKEVVSEVTSQFNQLAGVDIGRVSKQLGESVGNRGFNVLAAAKNLAGSRSGASRANIMASIGERYGGRIAELNTAKGLTGEEAGYSKFLGKGIGTKTQELGVQEVKVASMELEKTFLEISVQALKQKEAIERERVEREKLIGTISEQTALEAGIQNLEYSSKKASDQLSRIGESFGGSISGLGSNVSSDVFDLKLPNGANSADFKKALSVVSSIGPAGERVSKNFSDLNAALPKLEVALTNGNIIPGAKGATVDKLISSLGIDKKSDVGKIIAESISQSIDPKNITPREGVSPAQDIAKEIFKRASDIAESLRVSNKKVLDAMNENEKRAREVYDKINESRSRQVELQLEGVSKTEEFVKMIGQVRGTGTSLSTLNGLRSDRQTMLAGGRAGDPNAIGGRMASIRQELLGGGTPEQQAQLANEYNKLAVALKELGDQSSKTADTLAEIDKYRGQREAVSDLARNFTFGDKSTRRDISKTIQATGLAVSTGDINSVPGKMRAGVDAFLERFKDSPIFNGLTGKQVQNNLTANQFRQMGAFDIANMVQQGTSTPEEILVKELKNIFDTEAAVRAQLFTEEINSQKELTNVLTQNAQATRDLIANIPRDAAALAAAGGQDRRADPGELARQRKLAEDQIIAINNQIKLFNEGIGRLLQSIDALNAIAVKRFGGRAQGGPIYRADGGSVFQPRGTDTVPTMLTPGEFVMRREAVQNYGLGFMNRINSGSANYMADGGRVGGMSSLISQFSETIKGLNGVKMTHQVNVDGQLNIGGLNVPEIGERLKQVIGEYVGNMIASKLGNSAKGTNPNG